LGAVAFDYREQVLDHRGATGAVEQVICLGDHQANLPEQEYREKLNGTHSQPPKPGAIER
jgi:hypothetical protein